MASAPPPQVRAAPVLQINGPGGRIVVRQPIDLGEDEDDDDGGIPPEIAELIRVTEAIHSRAGGIGVPPRQLQAKAAEPEDNTPRYEESHDSIMAKMNKLSEEIGERHDREKLTRLSGKKSQRSSQVLVALGCILALVLGSFILTCGAKKGKNAEAEEDEKVIGASRRVGKAD